MMPEEVDGAPKHKRRKKCEKSCTQTQSTRLGLWLAEEVTGRIEIEVSLTAIWQLIIHELFPTKILILRKKPTSSGSVKMMTMIQTKSDG
jgi:hypothetical protein